MATFKTLQDNVLNHFGDNSARELVKLYINQTQQDIASRHSWRFLLKDGVFQSTDDYTTGTVAVTNGSATVTGTSTVWTSSMVGRKFRVDGDAAFYEILTFSSATSIELDKTFTGTTATGKDYRIYQDEYSLASDIDKLVDITSQDNRLKLEYVQFQTFDEFYPSPDALGVPKMYVLIESDSADLPKVRLYPIPDAVYTFRYHYRRTLTDLSADANVSVIPPRYFDNLAFNFSLFRLYQSEGDGRANQHFVEYENRITLMKEDISSTPEDEIIQIRSIDETAGVPRVRFPSRYPQV